MVLNIIFISLVASYCIMFYLYKFYFTYDNLCRRGHMFRNVLTASLLSLCIVGPGLWMLIGWALKTVVMEKVKWGIWTGTHLWTPYMKKASIICWLLVNIQTFKSSYFDLCPLLCLIKRGSSPKNELTKIFLIFSHNFCLSFESPCKQIFHTLEFS